MINPEATNFKSTLFIGFDFWGIISLVILTLIIFVLGYRFFKIKNKN